VLEVCAVQVKNFEDIFNRFDTIPGRDGQDRARQTFRSALYIAACKLARIHGSTSRQLRLRNHDVELRSLDLGVI